MRENMTLQEVPTFIFDDDGDFITCVGTTLEDLILSAAKVTKIRVESETDKITRAMGNLANLLHAVRRCTGADDFSHLCCEVSEAYSEVRKNARMRVLTGLSPDESTLILVFASPWVGECIAQVQTAAPQQPSVN
jgi:hypothetical protein